jgi:phosphopantetheinyl transferase
VVWTRACDEAPLDEVACGRRSSTLRNVRIAGCARSSPQTKARADRYRLERDRRRFVVRRAVLRLGLADWLDLPPERLRGRPEPVRVEAFYRCWTRKEAYVKAVGSGLSVLLHDFDVTLVPGEPAALARVRGRPSEPRGWRMQSLPLPSGYLAAIVVGAGAA